MYADESVFLRSVYKGMSPEALEACRDYEQINYFSSRSNLAHERYQREMRAVNDIDYSYDSSMEVSDHELCDM